MTNFHTHTFRCKHAVGTSLDYAAAATNLGFSVLGISDHSPLPDNRWIQFRMSMDELPGYIEEISEAAAEFPQTRILKGMECEYAPEYRQFYEDELLGNYGLDYLVGGAHFFPVRGEWVDCYTAESTRENLFAYTDYIISSIQYGRFTFIAHPDLFGNFYFRWDRETESCSRAILEAAADMKTPLEINGFGYRKPKIALYNGQRYRYPLDSFWELASEYDINAIINSDAHHPDDLAEFGEAHSLAQKNMISVTSTIY